MVAIEISLLILFVGSLLIVRKAGWTSLIVRQDASRCATIAWLDRGATPLAEKRFTPQGLTIANGQLVFANSWKDKNSRVYEISPSTMTMTRYFDMPSEACHTSGLAWDGTHLWAVDYLSLFAYCLDLESSFNSHEAKVIGKFATSLGGASACCTVIWEGRELLAISDFMNSRSTMFVDSAAAIKSGTAVGNTVFRYRNEGFSQGLVSVGNYLLESENKFGIDIINVMSLDRLAKTGQAREATLVQLNAPSKGVEDLAWDGTTLWTSDESVFRFFRTPDLANLLKELTD